MRLLYTTFIIVGFLFISAGSSAQGCVAIRGNGSCGSGNSASGNNLMKNEFLLQTNYRYFKSFRHFRGATEETHRIEEGTEVINKSNFIDLALNYGVSDRVFAGVTIPFSFHARSSMYEHGGNPPNGLGERNSTSSRGLGDVRLNLGYWLFNPDHEAKMNYAVSGGIKFPTGDAAYEDIFYNQGPDRDEDILTVVDQSIQPGDGGFGISLNVQGYHILSDKFNIVNNFYYLANVEETNGILTRNGNSEFSSADQYAVTLGLNYLVHKNWSLYVGGRMEGVPADDIIGGSSGYRRPGYAISVEPGLGFSFGQFSGFLNCGIAMYRNRTQSYEDKVRTVDTGVYRHGDAAFADYLLNVGIGYRFGSSHKGMKSNELLDMIDDVN